MESVYTDVDVGSSANDTFLAAQSLPPNPKVDKRRVFDAVVLQYEGVVDLAGITAELKLPTGFKAQYPLNRVYSDLYRQDFFHLFIVCSDQTSVS